MYKYEDSLLITDIDPLIDYICSTTVNAREILAGSKLKDFRRSLEARLAADGAIYVAKDAGVFEAVK
jgi:hypothetical protein